MEVLLLYLRALFPSWVLFDDLQGCFQLEARKVGPLGEWKNVIEFPKTQAHNLFLNHQATLCHWKQSLVDRYVAKRQDVQQDPGDLECCVEVELIQQWIQTAFGPGNYEWRIVWRAPGSSDEIVYQHESTFLPGPSC